MRGALSFWVIVAGLLIAVLLLVLSVFLVFWARPGPLVVRPATAVLEVIAAPTTTPSPPPTATVPIPTPGVAGNSGSGTLEIGAWVQVNGTGGDGLRLRDDPGLGGQVRLLAAEGEVLQISDGPQEVDGYTWWFVVNQDDTARQGWAVADYLILSEETP